MSILSRALCALGATACTAGGVTVPPPPPPGACAELGDYDNASNATLSFTRLQVNGLAILPDIPSIAGCVSTVGSGAAWTFDVNGLPYATIYVDAEFVGGQALPGPGLTVDLHGNQPPLVFNGSDFYAGSWSVNSLSPFATTLQEAAAADFAFNQLNIAFTASAAP